MRYSAAVPIGFPRRCGYMCNSSPAQRSQAEAPVWPAAASGMQKDIAMVAATRESVLQALQHVVDPATGKSIVESGLVQGLVLRDGHVGFSIEVDAARGRGAEPLRQAAERAVAALPGVLSVTAVLTAHKEADGQR